IARPGPGPGSAQRRDRRDAPLQLVTGHAPQPPLRSAPPHRTTQRDIFSMQTRSWLLAAALLACSVIARPEGRPEDVVEALAQPQQAPVLAPAQADHQPSVEVTAAQPGPLPDARPAELVPDEPKIEEEAMKPSPVPIEPGVMTPDDSQVFPEGGSLRSPGPQREEAPGTRTARTYLPAEARGAEADLELNLPSGTVLVPYYGGAKGQYLIVTQPVSASELAAKKKDKKKPARPGHKEEEEEEENVGEETDEKPPAPPADSGDTVTIGQPNPNASMAEAKPIGIAVAGEGGVASSRPTATALVGPGGLAVARPIATAIAGIQGAELLVAAIMGGGGGSQQVAPAHPVASFLYPGVPAPGAAWGPQVLPLMQPLQPLLQPAPPPLGQWLLLPPPYPYA
ncbi:2-succinyl-5-enolpyruvyl-6-hydroxy-3-cyclohexene-1-carboxylate synthase, partial [Frankliniella fusca]